MLPRFLAGPRAGFAVGVGVGVLGCGSYWITQKPWQPAHRSGGVKLSEEQRQVLQSASPQPPRSSSTAAAPPVAAVPGATVAAEAAAGAGAGAGAAPTGPLSAERPEGDVDPKDPGVTVLVASSFKELVIDADMDVLVETKLPGCRSCAALTPRVKMLAFLLQDIPSLRIGIMDIEANDPPMEYLLTDATPHLRMFPKGKKLDDGPVNVSMLGDGGKQGLPTVPELLEFVHANASTPFTLTDAMRKRAEAMEKEAEYLYECRLRMVSFVNMWRDATNLGPALFDDGKSDAHTEASDAVRDALFVAFGVLDAPGANTAQEATDALANVEKQLRDTGLYRGWLNGLWITSMEQYMEEVPALMKPGEKPVMVAFGNGSLETWTSETGLFLRDLTDDSIAVAHVDCAYQKELCERCDASAGAPAVHFYRGGSFVGKTFWENKDLVQAMMAALVAHPDPADVLPFVKEMEAKRKAAMEGSDGGGSASDSDAAPAAGDDKQ